MQLPASSLIVMKTLSPSLLHYGNSIYSCKCVKMAYLSGREKTCPQKRGSKKADPATPQQEAKNHYRGKLLPNLLSVSSLVLVFPFMGRQVIESWSKG